MLFLLLGLGGLEFFIGTRLFFLPHEPCFGYRAFFPGSLTGTYVNGGNLASLLVIIFLCGTGYFFARVRVPGTRYKQDKWLAVRRYFSVSVLEKVLSPPGPPVCMAVKVEPSPPSGPKFWIWRSRTVT